MRIQPCSVDATNANAPSLPRDSTTTMEDLIQCSAFFVKPQRRSFLAGTVDVDDSLVPTTTTTTTTTLEDHQCELASRRWSANDWTNLPFMPLEHCSGGAAVYTLQPRPSFRAKTLVLSPHDHGCATCTTATSTHPQQHPQQQQQSLIWLDSHGPPPSNSTTTRRPRPWPTTDPPTSTSRENPWTYDLDGDGGEENNYSTTMPDSADHHHHAALVPAHNRKRQAGRFEPGGPSLAWPLQDNAEPNGWRLLLLPQCRIKRHRRRHGTTTTTTMAPSLPHF